MNAKSWRMAYAITGARFAITSPRRRDATADDAERYTLTYGEKYATRALKRGAGERRMSRERARCRRRAAQACFTRDVGILRHYSRDAKDDIETFHIGQAASTMMPARASPLY